MVRDTVLFTLVSVQASLTTDEWSQKQCFTLFGPQKGSWTARETDGRTAANPKLHAATTRRMRTCFVIIVM